MAVVHTPQCVDPTQRPLQFQADFQLRTIRGGTIRLSVDFTLRSRPLRFHPIWAAVAI